MGNNEKESCWREKNVVLMFLIGRGFVSCVPFSEI